MLAHAERLLQLNVRMQAFENELNHLPEDCLLEMFGRIPLTDQMHYVQLVCRCWRRIHLLACRYKVTSLALIGVYYNHLSENKTFSTDNVSVYGHKNLATLCHINYHLKFRDNSYFVVKVMDFLYQRFPNISNLELVHLSTGRQISSVVKLMHALSGQLISLKIFYSQQDKLLALSQLLLNAQFAHILSGRV